MSEIREVRLPGVGVRLELSTEAGEDLAVIVHRGGQRELMVYDQGDPEKCTTVLHLTDRETRALSEMLGGATVNEVTTAVVQDVDGLAINWLAVPENSPLAGRSIGEGMLRSRTGVSIVAVVRGPETIPGPGPDLVLDHDDVLVAVGSDEGLEELRRMLSD